MAPNRVTLLGFTPAGLDGLANRGRKTTTLRGYRNVLERYMHPTLGELSALLASIAGNRNEALFRLMALTGIRRGEAVGLRWSDLQLDRHRLTVRQAATVIDG